MNEVRGAGDHRDATLGMSPMIGQAGSLDSQDAAASSSSSPSSPSGGVIVEKGLAATYLKRTVEKGSAEAEVAEGSASASYLSSLYRFTDDGR
jgi:hypothetical protein